MNKEKMGKGVKFERIRRITGYLVGTLDKWNNAKKAEEKDRVKHSGVKKVVHAKWVLVGDGVGCCSNCHRLDSIDNLATHCRYCGAKLDGDQA